mmetsp:Transcript_106760/g.238276  ORF Transcript_106760/g.238276 Transcript_106760/m.238276 type:complete len:219 (-) Transcript_106760:249-905(-)
MSAPSPMRSPSASVRSLAASSGLPSSKRLFTSKVSLVIASASIPSSSTSSSSFPSSSLSFQPMPPSTSPSEPSLSASSASPSRPLRRPVLRMPLDLAGAVAALLSSLVSPSSPSSSSSVPLDSLGSPSCSSSSSAIASICNSSWRSSASRMRAAASSEFPMWSTRAAQVAMALMYVGCVRPRLSRAAFEKSTTASSASCDFPAWKRAMTSAVTVSRSS